MKRSNIVEEAVIRLLKKNRFFANLIMNFNRIYVDDNHPVKTAAVSITDKINLYVYEPFFANPYKVEMPSAEQLEKIKEQMGKDYDKWYEGMQERIKKARKVENPTEKQIHLAQEAILIHECMHIMHNHIARGKSLDTNIGDGMSFNMQALNIAMDCAINQLHGIKETVDLFGGVTLQSFKEMLEDNNIEPNQNFEYYFYKIKQNAQKLKDKYGENLQGADNQDDHGQWQEGGEGDSEYQKEVVKNAVRKAAKQTGAGNIGGEIQLMIDELLVSKVNWKRELRKFMQGFVKYTKTCSRAKRHRKYGIVFPGKKKKYHAHIAVAVDTSGSMSDEDIKRCFSEIHKIATTTNIQITVIEADAQVTQVYPYCPKKEIKVVGRGGTAYNPAFKKAIELGVNGIIYAGDFDAFDTPEEPPFPTLWLGIGCAKGTKPPGDFGKVLYVDSNTGEFAKAS